MKRKTKALINILWKFTKPIIGLKMKFYSNPNNVGGWLGWLETKRGRVIGYIHQDGRAVFGLFGQEERKMKFPNIKKLLQKALDLIPLVLSIWALFEKDKEDEE